MPTPPCQDTRLTNGSSSERHARVQVGSRYRVLGSSCTSVQRHRSHLWTDNGHTEEHAAAGSNCCTTAAAGITERFEPRQWVRLREGFVNRVRAAYRLACTTLGTGPVFVSSVSCDEKGRHVHSPTLYASNPSRGCPIATHSVVRYSHIYHIAPVSTVKCANRSAVVVHGESTSHDRLQSDKPEAV